MNELEEFVAKRFVHAGSRWAYEKKKMWVAIAPLNDDGTLGELRYFDWSRKRDRVVGGVYTGTTFSAGSVKGLNTARFDGKYHDRAQILEWDVKHHDATKQSASVKLEKDMGKTSELEDLLLPLRRQYEAARNRYDHGKTAAIEAAVLAALRAKVRPEEK